MTDEEKAAMEWLDGAHTHWTPNPDNERRDTIKAMLAEPRLPKRLDSDALAVVVWALREIRSVYNSEEAHAAVMWNALYAHLTAPRTKEVEVWHCESAVRVEGRGWSAHVSAHDTKESAENSAAVLMNGSEPPKREFSCIRVTGPWKQEVPA